MDSSGIKMVSKLTGRRVFMLSTNSWSALNDELYKRFSTGAGVIFFEMGKSYGSDVGDTIIRRAESKDIKLDPRDFSYLVTKAGWGKVTLEGELARGSRLSVLVTSCAFCEGDEGLQYNCPFLKGMGIGVFATLYKRDYDITAACSRNSKGEHICKFELYGK
jgi:predicted hydrocarbon binding protein